MSAERVEELIRLGKTFKKSFDKLPEEGKEEVLGILKELLLWRGHTMFGSDSQLERIEEIAKVFYKYGMEQEELT